MKALFVRGRCERRCVFQTWTARQERPCAFPRMAKLKLTGCLLHKRLPTQPHPHGLTISRTPSLQSPLAGMDPEEVFMSDQKRFEEDLSELITDLLSGSSASTTTDASPPTPPEQDEQQATPRKRTYSVAASTTDCSPAPDSGKRPKLGQSCSSRDVPMHPARKAWLDEGPLMSPEPQDPQSLGGYPTGAFSSSSSSATAANTTPLGHPTGKATWSTLQNTIRRQWDPRKSDLEYEELLKHRRNEKLVRVDRYIPLWSPGQKPKISKKRAFPFTTLPDDVQDRIISLLLVSAEPIEIEFNWLRPFLKGHARVPGVLQKLESVDGTSYLAPVPWVKLLADVESMKSDMAQFKSALETKGASNKGRRSPARSLTTSLLRVSRSVHAVAARAFYGRNIFHFSYAPAAWMQLESFMETIGSGNVKLIKHIRIAAPMFHRGMQEDYVEGAILDLMSPATRMAVIKPAPRDRLLSAIKHSVAKLNAAASLESLALDLEHPMASDLWSGRYVNDKRLISVAEAERHFERKATGVALLKQASDALTAKGSKPMLTLHHFSKASRTDVNQSRGALAAVMAKAEKYGWGVRPRLMDGR